jgi:DNA-binding MarR family transcriptional regulator
MSIVDTPALPADYSRDCGGAAIGARLRRLSEAIDRDAGLAYRDLGIEFEQRWFGLLNLLDRFGPLSVGQIAASLRITHVAVSQSRASLETRALIAAASDKADARRRLLSLTPKGMALVASLRPLWRAMDHAAQGLNDEADDVVKALDILEAALARRSMRQRIADMVAA